MPFSIPELQQNDLVTIREPNGTVSKVSVQSVSKGKLDHDNQPFFIDSTGQIHWSGRSIILETSRLEPKRTKERKDARGWKERLTKYPDGTTKSIKEILLSRDDGKTFEDEIRNIVDGGKNTAKDATTLITAIIFWFPRQFPNIDTFDIAKDLRAGNLIGYRPAGFHEVEKMRIFRTGSVVKLVDNKDGRAPRRFGRRYVTYFGAGLLALPILAIVAVILRIF